MIDLSFSLVEIFYTLKKFDDIRGRTYEDIQSGEIISDIVTLDLFNAQDGNSGALALSIVNNVSSKDFKVYLSKNSEIEEIKLIPLKINPTTSGDH